MTNTPAPLSWFILGIALTLSACGFHPHGAYQLPKELKQVYLEGGSPAMREQMRQQIAKSGGQLTESRSGSMMVIKLFDEQFQRRTLSLSARGKANEYEFYENGEIV